MEIYGSIKLEIYGRELLKIHESLIIVLIAWIYIQVCYGKRQSPSPAKTD